MADRNFKPINFRLDKWNKILDLATQLTIRKGVDIGMPEAVDDAVTHYLTYLKEQTNE